MSFVKQHAVSVHEFC